MNYQIAIDGPSGAGKSTVADMLSLETGFIHVDTGAMFRAMAYHLILQGVDDTDAERAERICNTAQIKISHRDGSQQIFLNGENISRQIRREDVGIMASKISVHGFVREKLLLWQREIAAAEDVIMDGRDIGSCVLPDADLKIYLTADAHVRAMRRYSELREKGISCALSEVEDDILKRDERDSNRKIAPLKAADDAVIIDSSDMDAKEVVRRILDLMREKKLMRSMRK